MTTPRRSESLTRHLLTGPGALLAAGLALGCAAETAGVLPAKGRPPAKGDAALKGDQWNASNNPDRFNVQLEYTLDKLPREGRADRTPWPDTYWPTYEDSVNVRWHGRDVLSPAEKYDKAFNGWIEPEGFMDLRPYSSSNCHDKSWSAEYYDKLGPAATWTSANKGNLAARDGLDSDKDGETDECDDRDGVESWWGLCHAWVPAALLESEPRNPITYNGVTFEVSDLKALLISQYDRSSAYMIGGRCNDKEVKRDPKTGRILDDSCRDTNAGTWHVIMANMLGIHKRAIAEDRTYDYQVWNQPVLEFKVHSLTEIDLKAAAELLKLGEGSACDQAENPCAFGACTEGKCVVSEYPYNTKAAKLYEVSASSYYITESHAATEPFTDVISSYTREDRYQYILEVDQDGKISGGEWIGASNSNHPDFLWLPTASRGGNPNIDLDQVRLLVEKSQRPQEEETNSAELLVAENPFPFDIPDNDAAGITSNVEVAEAFVVAGLEVEVNIVHGYIGDLKVELRKGNKSVVLHDNAGGSTDNLKRTFKVTDMDGVDANGTWELHVADTANSDAGKLLSWKLKLHVLAEGTTPVTEPVSLESSQAVALSGGPEGTSSTLSVANDVQVRGVRVTVALSYTRVGDLQITLAHGAVKLTLSAQEEGDATTLQKTYDVEGFNGLEAQGEWTLQVVDANESAVSSGELTSWKLEVLY